MSVICCPVRFATGLIKTKEKRIGWILTSADIEGNVVSYNPDLKNFPSKKTVYTKKTYNVKDFQELTIKFTAGESAILSGLTYEGEEISTPISGNFNINLMEYGYLNDLVEGKIEGAELVDLDKKST